MRYAIELTLDGAMTRSLRTVKRHLAAALGQPAPPAAANPHVSLAVCADLDVERCATVLAGMALEPPLPVRFDALGIFAAERAVLFAAPVVTPELLALHAAFHDRVAPIASGQSALYLPGRWIPHCTLAERIPPDRLPEAVASAHASWLPVAGRFDGLRIVEIPTGRILCDIACSNS